MFFLLPIFLAIVPLAGGALVRSLCRDTEENVGESYLVGVLALFFLWEGLSVAAVYFSLSFRLLVRLYSGILLLLLTAALLLRQRRLRELRPKPIRLSGVSFGVALLFLVQLTLYFVLAPDTETDYTLENVRTILFTDRVYAYHPGTGDALFYPMSLRGRIQSLTPFYAYLSVIADAEPAAVVYRLAPAWGYVMCLIAYGTLLRLVIPPGEKSEERRAYCCLVLQLLLLLGSLSGQGIFYMLLHRGWRGETYVFAVLLPFLIYLCYRILHDHAVVRLVWLLMTLAVSAVWADLRIGTAQLAVAAAVCGGISCAMYLGRRMGHD